jgi:large-conductance mechanosensitive channel
VLNFFFICYVFYFLFLKLTGHDLIFEDFFFKVQININLRSNIFDFLIWALFIAIGTKKILKIQKTNECKKCYNSNKSPKKSQNLKKRLAVIATNR